MATTELNFGPEWLRALSDGVTKNAAGSGNMSSSSNPLNNPSITNASFKSKMVSKSSSPSSACPMKSCREVKYRYSREEMLSFLSRSPNAPPPKDLIQHDEVYVEHPQNPLALTELSTDEINLLSLNINSDFVLKKSNTTTDGVGGDCPANAANSGRMKMLNANHELPMNRTGSVGERSKLGGGNNGFLSGSPSSAADRINANSNSPYPSRGGGRGGLVSGNGRSAIRNSSNIVFTRLSSVDDTNGATTGCGNSATKTNPLFIPKKGSGLQRSSGGDHNPLSPSFGSHPWRSGSVATSNLNAGTGAANNGETKEWKTPLSASLSTSEAVKNWRNESGSAVGPSPGYVIASSKPPRKDFFADDCGLESHDTRKPGNGKSKPFCGSGRRLANNGEPDLFTVADADRDLFGGRSNPGTSPIASSGGGLPFNDLFSNRGLTNAGKSASNRFPTNREYRDSGTNSSSNHYRNDRSYGRFGNNSSNNNHYDRFGSAKSNTSHNEESEFFMERFRGRCGGDSVATEDDDYRRNSLPEWSLDDPGSIDVTRVGTFDSSGAFHEAMEDENDEQQKSPLTKQVNTDGSKEEDPKRAAAMVEDSKSNPTPATPEISSKTDTPKPSASGARLETAGGNGSKAKIDYFNDPTLSPNYRAKPQDNSGLSTDKPRQSETGAGVNFSHEPHETTNENPPTVKNQKMALEFFADTERFADLLKKGAASGSNGQVFVKENVPGFVEYSQANNEQRHGFPMKQEPSQDRGPDTLNRSEASTGGPAPYGSMLKHPTDEEERLLNSMKLSSLFNEFSLLDFDQTTSRIISSTATAGNTVPTVSTSSKQRNNSPSNSTLGDLFLRLASSQEAPAPIMKSNASNMESFINENVSAPPLTNFSASGFLQDLVDPAESSAQTCGGGIPARFSNILNQAAPGAKPPPQIALGNNLKIDSGTERQQHHQHHPPSATVASIMVTNWFYCDPQGQTQGPFTSKEMYDWYMGGYFDKDLLVKRVTDRNFVKLGELEQACGDRCPFVINLPQQAMRPSSPIRADRSGHPAPAEFSLRNLLPPFSQQQGSQQQAGPPPPSHHQPPMMNRFLSQQPPPALSNTNPSFVAPPVTKSFATEDSMLNSFSFIQNLKPNQANNITTSTANTTDRPNDRMIELMQQQRQRHQSNNDGTVPGRQMIPPPDLEPADNQMRMFLNHLMQPSMATATKEDLLALNSQQREQYLLEKFQQFNLTHDKDQLRQTLNEQYHLNQTMQPTTERMYSMEHDERSNTANKKHSLEESTISRPNNVAPVALQRPQSHPEPSNDFVHHPPPPQQQQQINNRNSTFHSDQPSSETPLRWLSKYSGNAVPPPATAPVDPAWAAVQHEKLPSGPFSSLNESLVPMIQPQEWLKKYSGDSLSPPPGAAPLIAPTVVDKFVPGALSVSDVEELQRREVEEHYRNQKQQQQQKQPPPQPTPNEEVQFGEAECGEFIEVDRKQKHRQVNNKQQKQSHKNNLQPAKESGDVPAKLNVPPSPPTVAPALTQMPQLPKKAVWGSQTENAGESQQVQSQPLSIAEIQRIQEEKEEEERRQREAQQMNAMLQQQRSQMKWASQPWKEQNVSNIKTLAEIQAEEAEKQAALMRKELDSNSKRRSVPTGPTPLSVIVAKGGQASGTAAWGNSSPKPIGAWGEDEDSSYAHAIPATNSGSVNYKNAVAAGQKPNSASWKQILKANPKVVKKIEDSELNVKVETRDDLLRISAELLNRHFDPVETNTFISIVKDLGSPGEVNELCQLYLGNNMTSSSFSRFFIQKKCYLIKKQQHEQERGKQSHATNQQSQQKKGTWNNGSVPQDDDDHRAVNYKSALNNSNQQPGKGGPSSNRVAASGSSSSAHIKPATLKQTASNKTKGGEEVNIMTLPVECMEEFDKWCLDVLKLSFELNIDAETFVSFLKDIASPDEINDYVQTYLGSNKTSRDFAKNFIAKRSYLRNKAKQREPYEDMCGPAPALTPSVNSANNDNNGFVTVSSSNKKKRNKNKNQNHD